MPTKNEKLEKLSREFHRLNFLRIKKIKDFNFLKKVHSEFGFPKSKCNGTIPKMNNLVNPLQSLLLSDCFDDKVMNNFEETFEEFKRYYHELSKDYSTILGVFRTFHQIIEVVGEDKYFPTSIQVIEMPVRIRIIDGVKTFGIFTTDDFPKEIRFRGKHVYNFLADNQVVLRFKVLTGGDKLLYSDVVKCLRVIVPKNE